LEAGLTTHVMNPLLNPQIARLKGSMGSLNPEGRTMESPGRLAAIVCVGSFVTVGVIGCAGEDSKIRQAKAARNGSLIRDPGVIFKRIIHIEAFFMILSFFLFQV
jgi:hypothetical protein